VAAALALAFVPAACGDEVDDARKKAEEVRTQIRTEAEQLRESLDSKRDRKAKIRELRRELRQLRREGSDRADEVERELREELSK
jgi:hypothetical protein